MFGAAAAYFYSVAIPAKSVGYLPPLLAEELLIHGVTVDNFIPHNDFVVGTSLLGGDHQIVAYIDFFGPHLDTKKAQIIADELQRGI